MLGPGLVRGAAAAAGLRTLPVGKRTQASDDLCLAGMGPGGDSTGQKGRGGSRGSAVGHPAGTHPEASQRWPHQGCVRAAVRIDEGPSQDPRASGKGEDWVHRGPHGQTARGKVVQEAPLGQRAGGEHQPCRGGAARRPLFPPFQQESAPAPKGDRPLQEGSPGIRGAVKGRPGLTRSSDQLGETHRGGSVACRPQSTGRRD